MLINQFLAGFVPAGPRGNPKLIETSNGAFADHPEPWVSIVNLASVADIERVARQTIDPRRFRANIYISETDPWSERDWIDKEVGFGAARLKIVAPIERCAATNVAPDTGTRDLNIPLILERGFGHIETGVYGEVVDGGTITPGDAIVLRP